MPRRFKNENTGIILGIAIAFLIQIGYNYVLDIFDLRDSPMAPSVGIIIILSIVAFWWYTNERG